MNWKILIIGLILTLLLGGFTVGYFLNLMLRLDNTGDAEIDHSNTENLTTPNTIDYTEADKVERIPDIDWGKEFVTSVYEYDSNEGRVSGEYQDYDSESNGDEDFDNRVYDPATNTYRKRN